MGVLRSNARTAPFKVEDSFSMNNKSGDENDKFVCWDANRGFLLINKDIKKWPKLKSHDVFRSVCKLYY